MCPEAFWSQTDYADYNLGKQNKKRRERKRERERERERERCQADPLT